MSEVVYKPHMSNRAVTPQKLVASSLSLLLASCSVSRPMNPAPGPAGAEDLARYVLVIQEAPDGQVTHTWNPATRSTAPKYPIPADGHELEGLIVLTGRRSRDSMTGDKCQAVYDKCWDLCMRSPIPPDWEHYIAQYGEKQGKVRYCGDTCAAQRNACWDEARRKGAQVHRFVSIDAAIEWVKRHRVELLAGSVVVIAGVAFAVAFSGGGVIILAPVLLVASAGSLSAPGFEESTP
ncbi:MAG TPA: hypothetical protein VE057_28435 [Archangium sp.]|nr:hypothetical protein [Archangium sp.]